MLTFYYNPLSPNARRVWLTLLEKNIPFEPIVLQLTGDQFEPDYLAINPFHHIPVIVDNGLRLIESLAILDYLEAQYPTPSLLPNALEDLATVRMVQFLTANELLPNVMPLIYAEEGSPRFREAHQQLEVTLAFMEELLGTRSFFGSQTLTLGDIVAGTVIPILPWLDLPLDSYPKLQEWCDRIVERDAWRQTQFHPEDWHEFKRRVQIMAKRRVRTLTQTEPKPILAKASQNSSFSP